MLSDLLNKVVQEKSTQSVKPADNNAYQAPRVFPQEQTPSIHQQQLMEKILNKTAQIGVVGLGYVGLPLAVNQADCGFAVTGFDVNAARVEQFNRGDNYIGDVPNDHFKALIQAKKLCATDDFHRLKEMDVVIVCVPTPLTRNRTPEVGFLESAVEEIANQLKPGQLVVIESTTYPGHTEEAILPRLENSGLRIGNEFFLAYSPERVDPGNQHYQVHNTPKVLGGITPNCCTVGTLLYQHSIESIVPVSTTKTAEMVKVFENTFRAVNIGLVNELALICDRLNINVWEVIDAAATKPFGYMKFSPGPGIGGHCIPIDPFYLSWKVKELGIATRFIELAGEVNSTMPYFVKEKLNKVLGKQFKSMNGSNILILGVAYKPDVADWRESPAEYIIDILTNEGAQVSYHDPFVPHVRDHSGRSYQGVALTQEAVAQADCVLILTHHSEIDYQWIAEHAQLVLDTRNATKDVSAHREKIQLL